MRCARPAPTPRPGTGGVSDAAGAGLAADAEFAADAGFAAGAGLAANAGSAADAGFAAGAGLAADAEFAAGAELAAGAGGAASTGPGAGTAASSGGEADGTARAGAAAKVLHLVSNRWFSALTDYALTAAAALRAAGAGSHVVLREDSAALAVARSRGLELTTVPKFSLALVPRLLKLIRSYQPQMIICYEGQEATLVSLIRRWLPKGCAVYRFYGRDLRLLKFPTKPSLKSWLLKASTQHLTGVIVPSAIIAKAVEPYFPGRCHQITMARHLPLPPTQPAGEMNDGELSSGVSSLAAKDLPKPPPKLLMLGRLDPVKGHREFVMMFKAMLERWPKGEALPSLAIRGAPKNVSQQSLEQWLRLYGVAEQVDYSSGQVDDLGALLAGYDAGVIYSQGSEVICRVGAEMLMAGLGIIVTDVGALSELNLRANATDVLVVPSIDTDEQQVTIDAMTRFCRERAAEGHEARAQRQMFYQRAFSYELMARRLLRLLPGTNQPQQG